MDKKILLVEDSIDLSEAVKIRLTEDKLNVFVAKTANDAIKFFKKESPDLIILDILLEEGNGLDVLKDIRNNYHSTIPAIVLTNLDKDQEIFNASNLGVAYYLIKSNIQLEEISEKVKSLLVQE